jgi:C_GCAxxG_C_C family probable redox protein
MTNAKRAAELFNDGYNCAQAVFVACHDAAKMSDDDAAVASGAFGGGVGGLGQTCGALCGAMMALYERHAPADPADADQKRWVRVVMNEFGRWFEGEFATTMCADLKTRSTPHENGYRACTEYVEACARRLCEGAVPFAVRRYDYASADYDKALSLRQEVLRAPLGLNLFDEDLAREADAVHFGAFDGDELIATVYLTPLPDAKMQVRQLAVTPPRQRGGVGRLLMRFAESFAKDSGVLALTAHVRRTAEDFYASVGYRAAGEGFIEVGIEHIGMEKQL